jgi:hypothetical protein
MVLAEYLVSQQVGAAWRRASRDRARANDLISRELAGEARETLAGGALEANAAIALAIGYRRFHPLALVRPSWAGINCRVPALLHVGRKAEGAHHIATRCALLVHRANINLLAVRGRVAELEADTLAGHDIALAIRNSVVNEAVGLGAERVLLNRANHEGGLGIDRRMLDEAECRYYGEELNANHYSRRFQGPMCHFGFLPHQAVQEFPF